MRRFSSLLSALAVSATIFLSGSAAVGGEDRIHGATTVAYGLMRPHKEAPERLSGATLAILPSSTTRGLSDLAEGKADIAMLAEPLESAAKSVNEKSPGKVAVADLVGAHVGDAYVQFIVHPVNPIGTLSKDE